MDNCMSPLANPENSDQADSQREAFNILVSPEYTGKQLQGEVISSLT